MKELYLRLWQLCRLGADRQELINAILHCHVYGLQGNEPDIVRLEDWFELD